MKLGLQMFHECFKMQKNFDFIVTFGCPTDQCKRTVGTVSHRIGEDHGGYTVHNPYIKHFDECYKNLKE